MIASVNPATGETIRIFEPDTEEQVEQKLARAAGAYREYRRSSYAQRTRWLLRAAEILEAEKNELGAVMTMEMGKTHASAVQEVLKSARGCRYYAENAERYLADEEVPMGEGRHMVRYRPIGPVLAVMPWNFPFWQVFRFAAPALMAGNVGLLKHASNVPQCALAIERIFERAGFPRGVFQTLLIGSDRVRRVIDDPRIQAATLTGSEPAGQQLASEAGGRIKKTVLELGGSDPFIVMPSADLEKAVTTAVQARIINNGQSCIAAKRFIVAREIAGEFENRFVAAMEKVKTGDPMDPGTELGPLATPEILEGLDEQVRKTVAAGGRVLTGGRRLDRPGNYYAPTVLAEVPRGSPAWEEELFGPVASLFRVDGIDEAIEVANATTFGLGASAWTRDERECDRFVDEIESGMVFVNDMVASDPRLPFGGVKHSGYGRELSVFGIREFVNIKTVVVR